MRVLEVYAMVNLIILGFLILVIFYVYRKISRLIDDIKRAAVARFSF